MAELNRKDIWGDDLVAAPGQYAKEMEKAIKAHEKLIESLKKSEQNIQSATTISKVTKETQSLAVAQKQLDDVQKKLIATQQKEIESLDQMVRKRQSLQEKVRSYQKDQKEDLKLMKEGAISRAEYTKRLAESNTEIQKARLRIQQLNQETKTNILQNTSLGSAYQKLTIQLAKATNDYKNLAASGTATTQALRSQLAVVDQLQKKVTTIDNSVGQFQRNVGNYPRTFMAAGNALRQFIGAFGLTSGVFLFARALQGAIKLSIDFERKMSEVKAISGATSIEFNRLKKSAVELGGSFKGGAIGVAEMQLELSRLGFTTQEILDSQEAILLLSKATGSDLSKSADLAGSTVRAFNKDAKETGNVAEIMAAGFNTTALSIDNYTESIKYVGPIANAANVSLEETTALLGVLANANIRGSQAGTSLRRILNDLSKDGRPLSERLKELAANGITLADAQDEVGRYAQTALIVLANQAEKVEDLKLQYQSVNGVLKETADIMTDNVAGSLTKAGNAWDAFILRISESKGYLKRLVDETAIIFDLLGNENARAIAAQRGFWADLFPTIDQLLNLEEYKKRLEEMKQANDAYEKITTEGFVKPFETWEQWQERQLKKVVNANAKKVLSAEELAKLEKEEQQRIAATVRLNESIIRQKEDQLNIQKQIYGDQTNPLTERLEALNEAEKLRTDIAIAESNKRVAQARKDSATLKAIEQELAIAINSNTQETLNERRNIIRQERLAEIGLNEEMFRKQIEDTIRLLDEQIKAEEAKVKEKYAQGLISRGQYERELAGISRSFASKNIEDQMFALESLLLPQVREYTAQRLELVKGNVEEEDAVRRDGAGAEKAILLQIAALKEQLLDASVSNANFEVEQEIAKLELLQDLYENFANSIVSIFDSISARRIQGIDAEIEADRKRTETEIKNAGDNDIAKKRIEEQGEKRREALEKKKRAEQRKAAIAEKAAAIISAIINTKLAVVKTLGETGFFGIPLSTIVGALGALQIAAIAAQPIPAFKDGGTTDTPIILAGEEGQELYKTPSGKVGLTPDQATVMKMPIGTKITPHDETMKQLAMSSIGQQINEQHDSRELVEEIKSLNKDLVKAMYDTAPGDLVAQAGLLYEVKKNNEGSKKWIRKKSMG